LNYKQITQDQLELWLNNPVTKTYLQCLWWSQDQIKEIMGNGNLIDRSSMENTYGQMREAEGQKQGYLSSTDVLGQLMMHSMLDFPEPIPTIKMPDIENILED